MMTTALLIRMISKLDCTCVSHVPLIVLRQMHSCELSIVARGGGHKVQLQYEGPRQCPGPVGLASKQLL